MNNENLIFFCLSLENQRERLSATVTDGTRLGFTLGCGASIYCLIYAGKHFTGALHSLPYRQVEPLDDEQQS